MAGVALVVVAALAWNLLSPGQDVSDEESSYTTAEVIRMDVSSSITTIAREQRISDRRLTNAGSTTPNSTVEFGERYFPLLRLDTESDEFNRPSHTWVYENVELGTYDVNYDLLVKTYTDGVSNRTLYDLLGRGNLEDYEFEYYVDGVEDLVEEDFILVNMSGKDGVGSLTSYAT